MMLVADTLRMVVVALLGVAALGGRPSVPVLIGLALPLGIGASLFLPASFSIIPDPSLRTCWPVRTPSKPRARPPPASSAPSSGASSSRPSAAPPHGWGTPSPLRCPPRPLPQSGWPHRFRYRRPRPSTPGATCTLRAARRMPQGRGTSWTLRRWPEPGRSGASCAPRRSHGASSSPRSSPTSASAGSSTSRCRSSSGAPLTRAPSATGWSLPTSGPAGSPSPLRPSA